MNIFEVNTAALTRQFLKLPSLIYQHDKNWTVQLGTDIELVFDPEKNSMFAAGNARRWVIYDQWNQPAGRIAAFYTRRDGLSTGGFGFFECTENYDCAALLLQTAIDWLGKQGCDSIEGPINFGEKDRFWGALTSGFDSPALYLDNYNPSYYAGYFEKFGLGQKDIINTYRVLTDMIPEQRLNRIARRLEQKENISFRPFDFDQIEKYATDLHKVYIHSFDEKNRLRYVSVADIIQLINANKKAFEGNLIWLAYQHHEPVGLLAFVKDFNQSLGFGRLRENSEINLKGFAFSVIPGFRNHGVEFGLFHALFKGLAAADRKHVLFFSGINAKTIQMDSFMQAINATVFKIHKTFTVKS